MISVCVAEVDVASKTIKAIKVAVITPGGKGRAVEMIQPQVSTAWDTHKNIK